MTRPPATPGDCSGIDCNLIPSQTPRSSLVWVVGPVVAGIGLALLVVLVIVFRRKRQPLKQPMDGGQVSARIKTTLGQYNMSIFHAKIINIRTLLFKKQLKKPFISALW